MFWDYISIFLVANIAGLFFLLDRNNQVYRYRRKLVRLIKKHGLDEEAAGGDPTWRIEVFDSVTYDEMVLKFWRRLDKFYPDKSFIRPYRPLFTKEENRDNTIKTVGHNPDHDERGFWNPHD